MRGIIKFGFSADSHLNGESIKSLLVHDDWAVLSKEELQLPENEDYKKRCDKYFSTIVSQEKIGLTFLYYVYHNKSEGIVTQKKDSQIKFGIRIFKYKPIILKENCEALVEEILEGFKHHHIDFEDVRLREDDKADDYAIGVVLRNKRAKKKYAKQKRYGEWLASCILLSLALFCIIVSFIFDNPSNPIIGVESSIWKWWIFFSERITGPLLITGAMQGYLWWSYRKKIVARRSAIKWEESELKES